MEKLVKKTKKTKFLYLLLFLIVTIVGVSTCIILIVKNKEKTNKNNFSKIKTHFSNVEVEKVKTNSNSKLLTFPGVAKASHTAVLFFRIRGPIITVNVKPGDIVKKGELLMQADPRDYIKAVNLLKYQMDAQKAKLEKLLSDYKRNSTLHKNKVVSTKDLEAAKSSYYFEYAKMQEFETALKIAKDKLEDTKLFAPFDGVITKRYLEKYEMARVGAPVLAIHDISTIDITAFIPESEVDSILNKQNGEFSVYFNTIKNKVYKTLLYKWNTEADPVTRTYSVVFRIKLPKDELVLPGMTAEIHWRDNNIERKKIYSLPLSAFVVLTRSTGKIWCYNPKTCKVVSRVVKIGSPCGKDRIQVVSGIKENDLIVTQGTHFMRENLPINPILHTEVKK